MSWEIQAGSVISYALLQNYLVIELGEELKQTNLPAHIFNHQT